MPSFLSHPVFRFFAFAIILFVAWLGVYEFWLHPKGELDKWIISQIIYQSGLLLKALGFSLIAEVPFDENFRTIGIDGGHSIWVGDPCNGLELFALFAGFVIAYPGKWKNKLLFIPIGIVVIHLVNVIRVAALAYIVYLNPDWLAFNHTYTFTITVYSLVFLLWYLWASGWNFCPDKEKTVEQKSHPV